MTLPRKCVSLLLIYCFAVAVAPHPSLTVSANNTHVAKQETPDEDQGLRFRLSEGTDQPETRPATTARRVLFVPRALAAAPATRFEPVWDHCLKHFTD